MTQQALLALLARTLPMIEQLGDYIGNGELDPDRAHSLGKRCDLILDIKDALVGSRDATAPTYGYIDVLVVSKGGDADHVRVGYARGLGVFGVRGEARPTPIVLRAARGRIIADGTLTADELGPQQPEWPLA